MRRKLVLTFIIGCIMLTGCSGLKNIQDLTYIVAIGLDYDEEKQEYTAYLQGLNFANVAKQEGAKPIEPIPIFIASASGETLNLAVSKLYKKSEPPIFFGHVETLVLSKRVVKHRFREVIEEVGRNRSLRHTMRVITTEEKLRDIFNIKALFNYPAVYTVLYKKNTDDVFQDEIKPVKLMHFLREFYEPMGIAKLPSVKIDHDSWKADKNYPVLYFDGFAIFQKQKFMNDLSMNDAVYINWLKEKRVSIDQRIEEDEQLVAAMKLSSPKMKIKYVKGETSPKFSIEIFAQADLLEKIKDIPIKNLIKLIEEDIKTKVLRIYNEGVEKNTDVLNVGEKWYREHPQQYKKLMKTSNFYLDKNSLKNVKVDVQIFHFNSYKYEQKSFDK
ncbi:Ger(x)C family spore germination protein [Neobacillus sp. YX16]|uniref:Ger(x)C family spore germination protein n=1 Tax=Neobacillus sp. YX16 TaxID=3047874 RepID=UPI0024C3D49A|nr:Ger(x)C family spore germination protein [Neobacillus sp. YX16]WHZ01047.1 Ger(x)C family spore germination protein [Neobacillus sp. YX16]